jgi:putative endonuclease
VSSGPATLVLVDDRREAGRAGEDAALAWYLARGYRLVDRNWRCSLGELDLVLARDGLVVICEVKARRGTSMGGPFEAVHPRKQRKLSRLAEVYLLATRPDSGDVRFDVASVSLSGPRPSVHVFVDAF